MTGRYYFSLSRCEIGIQNASFRRSSSTYATIESSGMFKTMTGFLSTPGAQIATA